MKRISLIILLALFTVSVTFAQTVSKSNVSFKIKNLGINTGGTIGGVKATVHVDQAQVVNSIEATANVATINTDNEERDTHLKSADFFDVQRFPHITMKSAAINHKSGNKYSGKFNVTIKDKTKQFDIPFTYTETGNTATLNGTFKLNRLDFGVGGSSLVLGNEVTVTVVLELAK
ncbi:YceI family protein [Mucilaginibacter auburnensis]|uniref:Polyisoprenoid-binding protein YceI n=1 Tax=Mucilaginibacter auburnensis TaxID=1457233 RepID=A0A2H9VPL6_9SPHI|nr:YceI family protein [Mucilaginibacter auburnensis]PJJ80230.1 polyisoprenoid-binding protein YceI [Mucilaginibacter auburnensis]